VLFGVTTVDPEVPNIFPLGLEQLVAPVLPHVSVDELP
jgi:hypothetical protein